MANMSYCRFKNTYEDLMDCYRNFDNQNLSENEKWFKDKLIALCKNIAEYYEDED